MGLIVDTNVLIRAERGVLSPILARLESSEEQSAIASVTLSELMFGVHMADTAVRAERRSKFIDGLLTWLAVIPFDRQMALRHSALRAALRRKGLTVGPHDLIIAATAAEMQWRVLTHNVAEFSMIEGLAVEPA